MMEFEPFHISLLVFLGFVLTWPASVLYKSRRYWTIVDAGGVPCEMVLNDEPQKAKNFVCHQRRRPWDDLYKSGFRLKRVFIL